MKSLNKMQESLTDSFVRLIESAQAQGEFTIPWERVASRGMPLNFTTGKPYSGSNLLLLWFMTENFGFTQNKWLTFKQAKDAGYSVKKGARGTPCLRVVPYKYDEHGNQLSQDAEEYHSQRIAVVGFSVFNIAFIEGIEQNAEQVFTEFEKPDFYEQVKSVQARYKERTGVSFLEGGVDQAYYAPGQDVIGMPNTFNSPEDYCCTLLHEMVHSTSRPDRCNRKAVINDRFTSFNERYAFEELVAEIGSAFLSAHFGFVGRYRQHASYLGSWLSRIKGDENGLPDKAYVYEAARLAQKAVDFILKP